MAVFSHLSPAEVARWDVGDAAPRGSAQTSTSVEGDSRISLSPNALVVLERRYLKKDDEGRPIETPAELVGRVARAVAAVDARYGELVPPTEARFRALLASLDFLPNSPTLMNAGRELGQLSACFTLPVDDSISDIFQAVRWAAQIQMTGGGTGFSFSRLRPAGDRVASTKGIASGPVSFIDVFNAATDAIKQGGARRGANMGILRVDHPDILDFATAKGDPRRWKNFNVSVAVTDEFMQAVAGGHDYPLRNPRSGEIVRRLDARKVWDLIVLLAWRSAEPGLVFIDRINAENPTPALGPMESTNPCAELPLLPFESCNLGSINVAHFVRKDSFDWDRLGKTIATAVHFLDNVIDASRFPLPQIAEITRANRKIGLGVMGWADALIQLGIPYDDDRALELAERLMKFTTDRARAASAALATRRGAFADFTSSLAARRGLPPQRNATVTAIAPTGTISMIAGCSSGIEPLYAVSYVRTVLEGTRLVEVHPLFRQVLEREGLASDVLLREVAKTGRLGQIPGIPDSIKRLFVTAYDVRPEWHVRMQAAFQRHCDNAVSKTVNLAKSSTTEDVSNAYHLAYDVGCKGITVYRDGSRAEQVLSQNGNGSGHGSPTESGHDRCPDCGSLLGVGSGCSYCRACGYSRCG